MLTNVFVVKIDEISGDAIKDIREIKDNTNKSYQILRNSIEKDGQYNPIVIRELTVEEINELKNKKDDAKYGIIDGHHRYRIAQELNKTEILATIIYEKCNAKYKDILKAFRINNSVIKMSKAEKGKAIKEYMESKGIKKGDQSGIASIGKELFGVEKSSAYIYVQAYEESLKEKRKTNKGRKKKYFQMEDLKIALKDIPTNKKDIKPNDLNTCEIYLEKIASLEKQLRLFKKEILKVEEELRIKTGQQSNENSKNYGKK